MLNSAAVMDAALLLVAAHETSTTVNVRAPSSGGDHETEHLAILQNKADLIKLWITKSTLRHSQKVTFAPAAYLMH